MTINIHASSIEQLCRCPEQWSKRWIEGRKTLPPAAVYAGTCYHRAQGTNFKQKIATKVDMPIADVLDAFDTYWNKKQAIDPDSLELVELEINWDEPEGPLKDITINLLTLYMVEQAPHIVPVEVEQPYSLYLSEDFTLVGRPDLILSKSVIDHKVVNRNAELLRDGAADKSHQASSYCLLTKKKFFNFHLAIKAKEPRIEVASTERNKEDLARFQQGILVPYLQLIKAGIFPKNTTGWWCGNWCGYFDICKPYRKTILMGSSQRG